MTHPHSTTAANICRACQMRKGYDNLGRVSFQLGLYFLCRAQILGDLSTCSTERPVATQHSLRNCVDHLAALSHIGYPIRYKFGLLCTLIDQSRGNDSITLRFFQCPGVFAIAMVSFSSLKFLTFAK